MATDLPLVQRTGHYWFLFSSALLGVVIFCLGFIPYFVDWKEQLFRIGGIVFGSTLGTIFGLFAGGGLRKQILDIRDNVDQLLTNGEEVLDEYRDSIFSLKNDLTTVMHRCVNFPWSTDEDKLKLHRKVLHLYHKTRKDEKNCWIYSVIDFSKEIAPGRLCSTSMINIDGQNYNYNIEAFLVDTRLILTWKGVNHDELISICIFKNYGVGLSTRPNNACWGVLLHSDWDTVDTIDPCLLSNYPLIKDVGAGLLEDSVGNKISNCWNKLAPNVGIKQI